jgi:hypothetical protein
LRYRDDRPPLRLTGPVTLPETIDRLHRRPPGPRCIVYLDQSVLSGMVLDEPGYGRLLDRLQEAVDAGVLVCPASAEHRSESTLADKGLWAALDELADQLSLGIRFHSRDEAEARELAAAAAEFSGSAPDGELWEEAFTANPHKSRDELFTEFLGGHIRVRAVLPPIEGEQEGVTRQKAIAGRMNEAYEELRRAGFSFEELAEANLQGMFTWKLGPLLDQTGFSQELATAQRSLADDPSSLTLGRVQTLATRLARVTELAERYPAIAERPEDFRASEALRCTPTLRYPALLRAALTTARNRKAQPGDELDVEHLVRGLSRSDIATADRSMAYIVRERKLIPPRCQLVSGRQGPDGIIGALDTWSAEPSTD